MAYLGLSPVAEAIYLVLQDSTLQAAVPGGWHDDLPQAPTYPCGSYDVREQDVRGFGTGGLPEIEVRVHVYSSFGGHAEAQGIMRRVIALLRDATLDSTLLADAGYRQCGAVVYQDTIPVPPDEINGVKVHEVVSLFRLWVEET